MKWAAKSDRIFFLNEFFVHCGNSQLKYLLYVLSFIFRLPANVIQLRIKKVCNLICISMYRFVITNAIHALASQMIELFNMLSCTIIGCVAHFKYAFSYICAIRKFMSEILMMILCYSIAQEWIEAVLGWKFPAGQSYEDTLKDGVVCCKLINKIKPGSVAKINETGATFKLMENVQNFQKALKEYGVPDIDVFQTVDLFEKKDIAQVTNTFFALGRAVWKDPNWNGPKLGTEYVNLSTLNWFAFIVIWILTLNLWYFRICEIRTQTSWYERTWIHRRTIESRRNNRWSPSRSKQR